MLGIEEIIMIGYPAGIWDKYNNMPIIRRGMTATHINQDYENRPEFMIDAACFPGSSGSPVFLYNIGGYSTKLKRIPRKIIISGQIKGNRVKLIGILYAGPQFSVNGEMEIIEIPTKSDAKVISNIPMNLGLVIKSNKLLEFNSILSKL